MNDALMHENECHSRLMPLLPGIYYVLKHNGHWEVVSVTEQSNTLFGYTQSEVDELSADLFRKLIHPDDYVFLREQKYSAMHEGKLYVSEYRMFTKQREVKYVRDQYTCYQKDGQWFMEGYVCETKPSEIREKLLQQLRAYRSAVDYNMISSITDLKGTILYANENFCNVSQYSQEELVGQNHRIINSGHHSKPFFDNMWSTISRGNPWHGEICNRAKDGALYWVDTVIMPIFDEHKKITNYLS
jgi:PAS domain S-box-containing protein